MSYNKQIGFIGEQYAAKYLQQKGYRILDRNFTSRWGELDIVAKHQSKIIFIEVKTRTDTRRGMPYEGITKSKLHHVLRTVNYYILSKNLQNYKHQLDVIGILLTSNNTVQELKHYENVGM